MSLDVTLEKKLGSYVEEHRDRLVEIIRDLVRIPSENTPPTGSEAACQQYVVEFLRKQDLAPTLYEFSEVPGLKEHPLYESGRNYDGRAQRGRAEEGERRGPFAGALGAHRYGAARIATVDSPSPLAARSTATAFMGAAQMT